jgi:hypothetical protein
LRISADAVLEHILEVSHQLIRERAWIRTRWEYHPSSPTGVASGAEYVDEEISAEILRVFEILPPAQVQRFFGVDKKQRRYICFRCASAFDWSDAPRSALLVPNTPESTQVRCFVCDGFEAVKREDCSRAECKGNVLAIESEMCLTCGHSLVTE